MVFDKSIKKSEELEQWASELGIQVHPNMIIKQTKDRGIGVFFRCENGMNEKVELIRIPRMSSYNLYTLQYLVNNKLNIEDLQIVKKCLRIVFRFIFGNESEILIAYMIGLFVLCKKTSNNNELKEKDDPEWKKVITKYVNVLMETKVGNLYGEHWNVVEDLVSAFPGNIILQSCASDDVESRWAEITELINEELADYHEESEEGECNVKIEKVKVEEILQICAAVRSRMLEIPRAIEKKEDSEHSDEDDFYVDLTMVPVLDFVNHDRSKRNAYFDVDLETKDIILYFDGGNECDPTSGVCEVFISYEEFEDLHRMFVNYGFVPRSSGVDKYLELPIIGYLGENNNILDDHEATKRLKLIRQSPNVQFSIRFKDDGKIDSISLVEEMYYGHLVFDESIDWHALMEDDEKAVEEKEKRRAAKDNDEEAGEEGKEEEEEEEDAEYYERGFELCEQLSAAQSAEEVQKSKEKFTNAVKHALAALGKKAKLLKELSTEYEDMEMSPTGLAVSTLLDLYVELSTAAIIQSPAAASCGAECADVLALRSVPLYNWPAPAAGVAVESGMDGLNMG
jgi:hypothetical protein